MSQSQAAIGHTSFEPHVVWRSSRITFNLLALRHSAAVSSHYLPKLSYTSWVGSLHNNSYVDWAFFQMAQPVLIVGAGISGLTLAQACSNNSIPFRIFERDVDPEYRDVGWGLTLSWSLPTLRSLLAENILARLPEAHVNKRAFDAGQEGNFTFYDLSNGEAKWKVPASERIRVSRRRLRKVLLDGVEVEWNKAVARIVKDRRGVHVIFRDGSTATGSLIVACDGSHSAVRKMIHARDHENYRLPIRFLGANVAYAESQVDGIRRLDPYFLQGSDSRTGAYFWFSFLETPDDSDAPGIPELGDRLYSCQVVISWPYREGFFGRAGPTNVPNTDVGQLIWMKSLSADWAEPFRSIVQNLPDNAEVKDSELSDWIPQRNSDEVFEGRVVLLGDAFHPMTMYRGSGANHAIVDVSVLLEQIKPLYQELGLQVSKVDKGFRDATERYEDEVIARTEIEVLASRQACMDAHDYMSINENSPLVRERLVKADLECGQP